MTATHLVGYGSAAPGHEIVSRPVLHPVRTPAGALVTGSEPGDHPWHRGIGIGLPDVDGTNLWGGPSYIPGVGYDAARTRHGVVQSRGARRSATTIDDSLRWLAASGTELLREERRIVISQRAEGLVLEWHSSLSADRPVSLGSPASRGRPGAAYGGFFWRLPVLDPARVHVGTADARGEDAVNGTVSPWLEVAVEDPERPWAARLTPLDERTGGDPWFVRVREYVGIGSSLAAHAALTLEPGRPLTVSMRIELRDGGSA